MSMHPKYINSLPVGDRESMVIGTWEEGRSRSRVGGRSVPPVRPFVQRDLDRNPCRIGNQSEDHGDGGHKGLADSAQGRK
jgi:hypothetical protein